MTANQWYNASVPQKNGYHHGPPDAGRKEKAMRNGRAYRSNNDYTQRYMIGCGTDVEATMDRANEVTAHLYSEMDTESAHFAHVYDRKEHRMTSGCAWKWVFIGGGNPEHETKIWHEW